jgi:DtxR family Mn-dependent transcriptional regulator
MTAWLVGVIVGAVLSFGVIGLFWPGWGMVPRWRRATRSAERVRIEDTLKHLYESELDGVVPSVQSVAGAVRLSADEVGEVLQRLHTRHLMVMEGDGVRLTASDARWGYTCSGPPAVGSYLADHTGFPETSGMVGAPPRARAVSARWTRCRPGCAPIRDPHGDPIPTAEGEVAGQRGVPLTIAPLDEPLAILHVEDDSRAAYAELIAKGLHPGLPVRLVEASPDRVRVVAEGGEHVLSPLAGATVSGSRWRKDSGPTSRSGSRSMPSDPARTGGCCPSRVAAAGRSVVASWTSACCPGR